MTLNAIPTIYKGILFRSQLEARWARVFDTVRWPWEYELFPLYKYIPDFILTFELPLLVEVKPALSAEELRQHTAKIDGSGWQGEALLLGARLWMPQQCRQGREIGLLKDCWVAGDGSDGMWGPADAILCPRCRRPSVASGVQCFNCRICGWNDGGSPNAPEIEAAWVQAGNSTQWQGA